MKFEVGDRVKSIKGECAGKIGTITKSDSSKCPYYVEFDGGDWSWKTEENLTSVAAHPVIVITTDGVTTTAKLREGKKVVKTATAKCAPSDTFNFNTGAGLAFDRLVGRVESKPVEDKPEPEKPQYWSGKVVCVSSNREYFTPGRVYVIEDGLGRDDDGTPFPYSGFCVKSLDELNKVFAGIKFIEYQGEAGA